LRESCHIRSRINFNKDRGGLVPGRCEKSLVSTSGTYFSAGYDVNLDENTGGREDSLLQYDRDHLNLNDGNNSPEVKGGAVSGKVLSLYSTRRFKGEIHLYSKKEMSIMK